MKTTHATVRSILVLVLLLAPLPSRLFAQSNTTGTVEFVVMATPTNGRPESALRLPIFLLRKSYAEIQKEAEKETPPTDMTAFVDSLDVSTELKDWMKKKKTVRLTGQDFVRQLSTDDIMRVPEFWEAYLTRNGQDVNVGFPRAKFKESDPEKNPEKYNKERQDYRDRIKKYLERYQHTKEGIDLALDKIDPGQRWAQKEAERRSIVHQLGLRLAQTRYLVTKGETDLQGRGGFTRVPPGELWLSTLEQEAVAGDARLRWDLAIIVRAGAPTQIELSNVNALPRPRR